jgi:hypothetical protein
MIMKDDEQLQVRPIFRILGAVMMVFIAALMIFNSVPFFSADKITPNNCANERKTSSRFLCKIGNEVLSMLSEKMQGPAEAITHLIFAALLIYFSWLLLRPLLGFSPAKAS